MHDQAPHTLGPGALLFAEITSGGLGGHLFHTVAAMPPWLGGGFTALVVGVTLRVADPVLRAFGEWLATCAKAFVAWLTACARALVGRLRRR